MMEMESSDSDWKILDQCPNTPAGESGCQMRNGCELSGPNAGESVDALDDDDGDECANVAHNPS